MTKLIRVVGLALGLGGCLILTGCASQPISLAAEGQTGLEAQTRLRYTAAALSQKVDDEGWSLTAPPQEAARAFFGRLINGASEAEPDVSPVITYLNATETPSEQILTDLEFLIESIESVARDSLELALSDAAMSRRSLIPDLAATESALGAVRRADGFFNAVAENMNAGEDIQTRLSDLASAQNYLLGAADALSARHWSEQHTSGLTG